MNIESQLLLKTKQMIKSSAKSAVLIRRKIITLNYMLIECTGSLYNFEQLLANYCTGVNLARGEKVIELKQKR